MPFIQPVVAHHLNLALLVDVLEHDIQSLLRAAQLRGECHVETVPTLPKELGCCSRLFPPAICQGDVQPSCESFGSVVLTLAVAHKAHSSMRRYERLTRYRKDRQHALHTTVMTAIDPIPLLAWVFSAPRGRDPRMLRVGRTDFPDI